ncbi:MAG: sulfite exporter TauE/SafE family protein [Pseudomonadota bacterium]
MAFDPFALPLAFYLVTGFAVLITGLSKSGFGGGLGVAAVPLISLFVAPQLAVAVMMPVLLVMDIVLVWQFRRSWNRQVVAQLLPGALVGLALGAVAFEWTNAAMVKLLIGVLALSFVAQQAWKAVRKDAPRPAAPATVFSLGALSGFGSYVAHAGGPPVKGVLLQQQLEKSIFVGTNTMFFFTMNALKTVSYTATGHLTTQSLIVSLIVAPMLVLGLLLGTWAHRRVDQAIFMRIVYGFLTLAGAKLLWDGVWELVG